MFSKSLHDAVDDLIELYRGLGLKLATAESCTGGLIAGGLTEVAGASDVLERGFVTYSNEAKSEMLGVPETLIARVGAVSAEVAESMARGALERSRADVAVSATGIAGPGGATPGKPVGLVYLGVCRRGGPPRHLRRVFAGDREAVRRAAVAAALELAREALDPARQDPGAQESGAQESDAQESGAQESGDRRPSES